MRLAIHHNTHQVWQAEIDGGDGQGVDVEVSLEIHCGDAVRFVVHKRGKISCDTTHWDPVITYAGGDAFQASNGFSTRRQGEHGWSYAMQVSPGVAAMLPRPGFRPVAGDLAAMVEAEWRWEDRLGETEAPYATAIKRRLDGAGRLLADLRTGRSAVVPLAGICARGVPKGPSLPLRD